MRFLLFVCMQEIQSLHCWCKHRTNKLLKSQLSANIFRFFVVVVVVVVRNRTNPVKERFHGFVSENFDKFDKWFQPVFFFLSYHRYEIEGKKYIKKNEKKKFLHYLESIGERRT